MFNTWYGKIIRLPMTIPLGIIMGMIVGTMVFAVMVIGDFKPNK